MARDNSPQSQQMASKTNTLKSSPEQRRVENSSNCERAPDVKEVFTSNQRSSPHSEKAPTRGRNNPSIASTSSSSSRSNSMASLKYFGEDKKAIRVYTDKFIYPQEDPLRAVVRRCPKVTTQMGEEMYVPLDVKCEFGTPTSKLSLPGSLLLAEKKKGKEDARRSNKAASSPPRRKSPVRQRKVRRAPRYAHELDDEGFAASGFPRPLCFARATNKGEIYQEDTRPVIDLFEMIVNYRRQDRDEDEPELAFLRDTSRLTSDDLDPVSSGCRSGSSRLRTGGSRSPFSVRFAMNERPEGSAPRKRIAWSARQGSVMSPRLLPVVRASSNPV